MKQHIFSGSATALITPFSADGKDVDYSFFEEFADEQIRRHTDALVVAGTTGESPVLSKEEKRNLIACCVQTAANRVPVIAGTGSNDTAQAVRKSNDAEKQGVDALLIVTPYYNKCTQQGLIDHYFFIADRVSTPIIVYNVPSRTGVDLTPETCKALSEHKNICAVKEASGNLAKAGAITALCGDSLAVYSGNDDVTVPVMSVGGKGVISVAGNIIPETMHEITKAAIKNDFQKAAALQAQVLDLMQALFLEVNPIPVKSAVEMLYSMPQALRLPLTGMSEKNRKVLQTVLERHSLV